MDFLFFLLSCLYFFLPAYFANITPPLINKAALFNFFDRPVDFGKNFLGWPIFGSHKTWRGVIFGVIVGLLIVFFQFWLYQIPFIKRISFLDYQNINILAFGLLISLGAVFGDLFFAFIKRRLKLKPGAMLLPFDQTNYVIGSFIFLQPFLKFNLSIWVTIFVLSFFLHIIVNRLGYYLKLHGAKW